MHCGGAMLVVAVLQVVVAAVLPDGGGCGGGGGVQAAARRHSPPPSLPLATHRSDSPLFLIFPPFLTVFDALDQPHRSIWPGCVICRSPVGIILFTCSGKVK